MGDRVKLNTVPTRVTKKGEFWVIDWPRVGDERGTHHHTYGMLTPYFEALGEGRLLATRCINRGCPIAHGKGELWLPPRADCPDCHQPMVWQEIPDPEGYVYAYTFVERGGAGMEIELPYYQVDVRLDGVCTIVKGYLLDRDRPIGIGDRVRAVFRTGPDATHTCLDLAWELM